MMAQEAVPGSYVDIQIVSPMTAEVLLQEAGKRPFSEQVAVESLLPEDRVARLQSVHQAEAARQYSTHAVQHMGRQALGTEVYYRSAVRQLEAGMDIVQITVGPRLPGVHVVKNLWERVTQQQANQAQRTRTRSPLISS